VKILQVGTTDAGGGAERVALQLHEAYTQLQHRSWLAVGDKRTNRTGILEIPNRQARHVWERSWLNAGNALRTLERSVSSVWMLRRLLTAISNPPRALGYARGHEDFDFPGTWRLLDLPGDRPDIVHCHNLHGSYFDLRALPWLSSEVPVVLTLHDAWLTTGHCAHSFGCERWVAGCGKCPDLTIYPAVRRDATSRNWRVKQRILQKCRVAVVTPSAWLMEKVKRSMLMSAATQCRTIPNGIDLSLFHPADRREARLSLGIPQDVPVLLFTASGGEQNRFKDYATLRVAIEGVGKQMRGEPIRFYALGNNGARETLGTVEIWNVGHVSDPCRVAQFYQAANVYIHASNADTFPNTVIEALACGIPVVATAVGGIPEQVDDGKTGFLVPPADARTMVDRIVELLHNADLRERMSRDAARVAQERFDLRRQAGDYLRLYQELERPKTLEDGHASPKDQRPPSVRNPRIG
jgi:glycosyltransferase involved in cell wall biosynthesis